jgi:hypothetical protein
MPLVPGSRLGPYEVLAALGAGGMGEVYRAAIYGLEDSTDIRALVMELKQLLPAN